MPAKKIFSFILITCFGYSLSWGQNIQSELLTSADGLASNEIIGIQQDEQGLIWVATAYRINRYDGQYFTPITLPSDAAILHLKKGRENNLWIFQAENQITRLNTVTGNSKTQKAEDWEKNTVPNLADPFELRGNEIVELNGFGKILHTYPVPNYTSIPTDDLKMIALQNGDVFWCNNGTTIFHHEHQSQAMHQYDLSTLVSSPITQLFKDQTNILWGATRNGLLKIKYQQPLFETYMSSGDEFCEGGGNCRFRGIAEDADGNIYFSYYNSIHVLNPQTNLIRPLLPNRKNFNTPFDLLVFQNQLWTNASKRVDLSSGKVSTVLPAPYAEDFDNGNLMIDKNGKLWLGRKGNLWKYNEVKDRLELSKISDDLETEEITYLLPSNEEHIFWVGTNENGLLKIHDQKGVVRSFSTSNSNLRSNFVRVLFEDKNQALWIGTPGGLFHLDIQKNTTERYSVEDGLPNDNINSILSEGDSALWIGTDLGLSRFHIRDKSFINFFVRDGLPDNEFNRISFHQAKNGRMYLGGLNGVIAFYPEEVLRAYRSQQSKSRVVLTSFVKQQDRQLTPTQEIWHTTATPKLDIYYQDKDYTFNFALTDYLAFDEVRYSYKLEGKDLVFSPPSKSNAVQYSNLSAGNYVLRVKAMDAKGDWNPNPLSLKIEVHPPWWDTSTAYGAYTLILGLLIFGIYRFLKGRWELQSELQTKDQEAERLKDVNDFKTRLYANITHEFRTPLTVILGLSDQINEKSEDIAPEVLKRHTGLITSNGKNLLHLINQMLDLSKLESSSMSTKWIQGDIIAYLNSIVESFVYFAEAQRVNLVFTSDVDTLMMDFDKDKMLKIVSNLISNALKFTDEGGEVKVVTHVTRHQKLLIEVSDTGIGIPPEAVPHIFDRFFQATTEELQKQIGTGIGLSLVRELVKLLHGTISVTSTVGQGTTFEVNLPINNNAPTEKEFPKIASIQQAVDAYTIWSQGEMAEVASTQKTSTEELPTLLIIEDNQDIIAYLKTILAPLYNLRIATNGKIGVETATEVIPDIIISDVMMPIMDGFEVCNLLKNDERTSHIPIILLTARNEIQSKLEGLERGADAYLSKPFNKKELLIRLEKLVTLRKKLQARWAGFEVLPPSEEKAVQIEDAFLQKLRQAVEDNLDDPSFGIPQLCKAVHLSRMQVHRKLKALSGQTTSHFIRLIRLQKAKSLMRSTDLNISEIAYDVGFNDPNYFSRTFAKEYGKSPSQFLEEARS
ncbi:MAG: ATP-binding protein [Bacteroidota bacterium]